MFGLIAWEAFCMTFVAEWGDRSQITTISLAVSKNPVLVCAGALMGHFLTTWAAVAGGSLISKYITERTVSVAGGLLFIGFSVWFGMDFLNGLKN